MNRLLSFVLLASLAACSQEPAPAPAPDRSPEAGSPPASSAALVDAPAPEETGSGFVSRYTRFDLAACEVLREERVEGSFADYRCPGLPGHPLLVQEGDGRFDLDAGIDDDRFQTIGAFNDIGATIEWRLRDGEPFAVIFRYLDRAMMEPGRTVLAIEKVGRPGAPGCRVAQVAGDVPDANRRARALADSRAAPFSCGADDPVFVGTAR